MEGAELRDGRARVVECFIQPLTRAGMARRHRQSEAALSDMLDRLANRLAYMTAENLAALVEVVERYASGKDRSGWPPEVSICNWARDLQSPPASESRLVRSYLQSGAGDAAAVGGYLVELFAYLKKFGAPPNEYACATIRQEAEDNSRRRAQIAREHEQGTASPRDLAWLQGYMDARRRCLDIISAKQERVAA